MPDGGGVRALRAAAPGCRGCELWRDATQVVFSSGPARAAIVLVGEQPGDREDIEGEPFVGPAGALLMTALADAGIEKETVYLTNAVKHFRHHREGKRRIHDKPGTTHIVACHPWLAAEFAAVRPRVVVCLGATAGRSVLGRPVRVTSERGSVLHENGSTVLITTHPSALLRSRGRPEWDRLYDAFVADLHTAAGAARG